MDITVRALSEKVIKLEERLIVIQEARDTVQFEINHLKNFRSPLETKSRRKRLRNLNRQIKHIKATIKNYNNEILAYHAKLENG